jgi:hypothetical protein
MDDLSASKNAELATTIKSLIGGASLGSSASEKQEATRGVTFGKTESISNILTSLEHQTSGTT